MGIAMYNEKVRMFKVTAVYTVEEKFFSVSTFCSAVCLDPVVQS